MCTVNTYERPTIYREDGLKVLIITLIIIIIIMGAELTTKKTPNSKSSRSLA